MATETAKQREIRLQIEDLVQQHINASENEDGQPEGLIVLEVAIAVYTRHPDIPQASGYYIQISDPATAPHHTAGLFDYAQGLADQDTEED